MYAGRSCREGQNEWELMGFTLWSGKTPSAYNLSLSVLPQHYIEAVKNYLLEQARICCDSSTHISSCFMHIRVCVFTVRFVRCNSGCIGINGSKKSFKCWG